MSTRAGGVQSPDFSQERGDYLWEASTKIASDSLVLSGADSALRKIRLPIFPTTNAAGDRSPYALTRLEKAQKSRKVTLTITRA